MTAWEVCHYAFPDDDGETLERVLDDLPPSILPELVGSFSDYSVLLLGQTEALFVLLVMGENGVEPLKNGFLYVPDHARHECISVMSQWAIAAGDWWRLWDIEFGSAGSLAAFEALSFKHGFSRQI